MNDRIIEFDPLIEGVLIKRYKRFLADIKLENGEVVTAHCANTGPMKGLLSEGAKVRLSVSPSPKRKLPFTWEQISVVNSKNITNNDNLITNPLNSEDPNKIFYSLIDNSESLEETSIVNHSLRKSELNQINMNSRNVNYHKNLTTEEELYDEFNYLLDE